MLYTSITDGNWESFCVWSTDGGATSCGCNPDTQESDNSTVKSCGGLVMKLTSSLGFSDGNFIVEGNGTYQSCSKFNWGMVIRLESHTNSWFSDEYNLKLSGRRAASTYLYLIDSGVAAERITEFEGLGESVLLDVKTADGTKVCTDGVKCTEAEHQLNRLAEFIIIKMK